MGEAIRFEDGAGYERMMGTWSRIAGAMFLDWLAPQKGLRWLDVGCGNGAFTEMIAARCAPSALTGIDPSEGQLAYARNRPGTPQATYVQGDAMALPFPGASFDAAVMALVLFFVPEPARGVAEMRRVLAPGGLACAYAWDILGGGFPLAPLQQEMRAMGLEVIYPPSVEAAELPRMRALWEEAGFVDVRTTAIEVQRTFASFEELWEIAQLSTTTGKVLQRTDDATRAALKRRMRAFSPGGADGRITWHARANAVRGRVAG